MKTGGGDADQHITGLHLFGFRQNAVALDGTEGKSGEIKMPGRVHARHFRGFATDQSTSALMTGVRNAFDHGSGVFDCEGPGGIVIKEEKRLRALNDDVVYAHRDEVLADGG